MEWLDSENSLTLSCHSGDYFGCQANPKQVQSRPSDVTPRWLCLKFRVSREASNTIRGELVGDQLPVFHVAAPSIRQNRFTNNEEKS